MFNSHMINCSSQTVLLECLPTKFQLMVLFMHLPCVFSMPSISIKGEKNTHPVQEKAYEGTLHTKVQNCLQRILCRTNSIKNKYFLIMSNITTNCSIPITLKSSIYLAQASLHVKDKSDLLQMRLFGMDSLSYLQHLSWLLRGFKSSISLTSTSPLPLIVWSQSCPQGLLPPLRAKVFTFRTSMMWLEPVFSLPQYTFMPQITGDRL